MKMTYCRHCNAIKNAMYKVRPHAVKLICKSCGTSIEEYDIKNGYYKDAVSFAVNENLSNENTMDNIGMMLKTIL